MCVCVFQCRSHFNVHEIVAEAQRTSAPVVSVCDREEDTSARGRSGAVEWQVAGAATWGPGPWPVVSGLSAAGEVAVGKGRSEGHVHSQSLVRDSTREKGEVLGLLRRKKVVNDISTIMTICLCQNQMVRN